MIAASGTAQAAPATALLFRSVRYFSTAIAAVVASPTAVVTWRVSWARRSPAAKSPGMEVIIRSEEHTSELQSPYVISYAVFCLKKKILFGKGRVDLEEGYSEMACPNSGPHA